MEIKTTEELRVLSEESLLDVWKCIADKKWVAVDDLIKRFIEVENQRITDNNDYISIPMKDWLAFRNDINQKTRRRR